MSLLYVAAMNITLLSFCQNNYSLTFKMGAFSRIEWTLVYVLLMMQLTSTRHHDDDIEQSVSSTYNGNLNNDIHILIISLLFCDMIKLRLIIGVHDLFLKTVPPYARIFNIILIFHY